MLILIPTLFEAGFLLDERCRAILAEQGLVDTDDWETPVRVAICGFGLAAAGAGAAHAIHSAILGMTDGLARPDVVQAQPHVILVGIAGSYDTERAPVGSAVLATGVHCSGIGVGRGGAHIGAQELGWSQGIGQLGLPAVRDYLPLGLANGIAAGHGALCTVGQGALISVTAASADVSEARALAAQYPDAVAEEMEAFSVGLAARLCRVPLTVIRGISNVAGMRVHSEWRVAEAMESVNVLLNAVISTLETERPA